MQNDTSFCGLYFNEDFDSSKNGMGKRWLFHFASLILYYLNDNSKHFTICLRFWTLKIPHGWYGNYAW